MLGPHIKFKLKSSCTEKSKDKKTGASVVVLRGIKKISLLSNLNKSASIWNAPLRPIRVGPIRRCANANSFLSTKTTSNIIKTDVNASSSANS